MSILIMISAMIGGTICGFICGYLQKKTKAKKYFTLGFILAFVTIISNAVNYSPDMFGFEGLSGAFRLISYSSAFWAMASFSAAVSNFMFGSLPTDDSGSAVEPSDVKFH